MSDPREPPVLTPAGASAAPTWRAAYSDRTAALMAAFSQLAYEPVAGESTAGLPAGRPDLKTLLAAGGFNLVAQFNRDDTQAYLAVKADQFAVLAFRGTTDLADWKVNADVLRRGFRVPVGPPIRTGRTTLDRGAAPDVQVHAGFLGAFDACRDEIIAAVNTYVPSDLGLYITGHSLGGALAQIASAVLERDNLAACYTYGSPRVGTSQFDVLVKCPHYRLVHHWDLVPGVPFPSYGGYRHSGDPRLLLPREHDQAALRRERNQVISIGIALFSFAESLLGNGVFVIDDHMIWNYRRHLEAIARFRERPAKDNPPPAPLPTPPSPPSTPPH